MRAGLLLVGDDAPSHDRPVLSGSEQADADCLSLAQNPYYRPAIWVMCRIRLIEDMFCSSVGLLSFSAKAQTKTKIAFDCDCPDPVGEQYATNLRDLLASSLRYSLITNDAVEHDSTGKPSVFHFHISAASLDPTSNNSGQQTVLSIVLLKGDGFFLTQQVLWCPIAKVKGCSETTLSYMDGFINSEKKSN